MTRRKQKPRLKRAVLGAPAIEQVRTAAENLGPCARALIEWLYTNAQRASEAGLAREHDLDLYNSTVMLAHLKGGLAPEPMPLAPECRDALEAWLPQRVFKHEAQRLYVFPSANPLTCYPCAGTKLFTVKSRKKSGEAAGTSKVIPCPHCHAMGTRWGMTRHEVDRVVVAVFKAAGVPERFHFPHILRHSAVTHMLNSGSEPPEIQERVGHKSLATTFGYMHTTDEARAKVNKAFARKDKA
jgi:integrase